MERSLPRGLVGAAGGVLGTIPLLPIARTVALKVFPAPRLPGAALRAADVKGATYFEAAVLLVALPAAALFFGHVLPRLLESRTGRDPAISEWPGASFALSLVLWRSGLPAKFSLLGGLLFASLAAAGIPGSGWDRVQALFSQGNRTALFRIFLAGAFWGLAWRSALSDAKVPLADLPAASLLAGALFVSLALILSRAEQKDTG
jgi:hypothetical protein